jgi:hypothetical protein
MLQRFVREPVSIDGLTTASAILLNALWSLALANAKASNKHVLNQPGF